MVYPKRMSRSCVTLLLCYLLCMIRLSFFCVRFDNYEMKSESVTPEFKFEADYVMEGQVLVLPVKGKGKCFISLGESVIHRRFLMN